MLREPCAEGARRGGARLRWRNLKMNECVIPELDWFVGIELKQLNLTNFRVDSRDSS